MLGLKKMNIKQVQKNKSVFYDVICCVFFVMTLLVSSITSVHAESRTLSNLDRERSSLIDIVARQTL